MNEKIYEFGWLILALLSVVVAIFDDRVGWLILALLCYIISLQHYKIRKSEEVKK